MCGRYSVLTEDEIIEIRSIIQSISMQLVRDAIDPQPRASSIRAAATDIVAPTDSSPILSQEPDGIAFGNATFGFKKWEGKGVIINARAETVAEKGMFSRTLNGGRCVIPAGEYYEWQDIGKKKKNKYFIKDKNGLLLFFAGVYRDTSDGREFVIITKTAAEEIADVHDRMPVLLRINQIETWLNGSMPPEELLMSDVQVVAAQPNEEPLQAQQLSFL